MEFNHDLYFKDLTNTQYSFISYLLQYNRVINNLERFLKEAKHWAHIQWRKRIYSEETLDTFTDEKSLVMLWREWHQYHMDYMRKFWNRPMNVIMQDLDNIHEDRLNLIDLSNII